jgi:acetoin utilization protein AcuB
VLVEDVMTREVITAYPEMTVMETLTLARSNRIRHVPVTENGILKGVVSDRDLRDVSPSILASMDVDLLENTLVKDIMVKNVITVHPLDTVEEAARLLYKHKIGCLPVVTGKNKLAGIVTDGDILFCFVEMMGMLERGTVLRVEIPDDPSELIRALEIVQSHRVNIISFFLLPKEVSQQGFRQLLLRLQSIDPSRILADLRDKGYTVKLPEFWRFGK